MDKSAHIPIAGTNKEYGRTFEAALSLLAVRLTFALLPFRWALLLLRANPGDRTNRGESNDAELSLPVNEVAAEIARAVNRAARYLPFRFACLPRAFAALLMLRRRGIPGTVHLGLARDTGANSLSAHAWCVCGDVPVIGLEEAPSFASVVAFRG